MKGRAGQAGRGGPGPDHDHGHAAGAPRRALAGPHLLSHRVRSLPNFDLTSAALSVCLEESFPGSCRLRSKRYVSDGLCVSPRPINEVVCAVSCVMDAWSKVSPCPRALCPSPRRGTRRHRSDLHLPGCRRRGPAPSRGGARTAAGSGSGSGCCAATALRGPTASARCRRVGACPGRRRRRRTRTTGPARQPMRRPRPCPSASWSYCSCGPSPPRAERLCRRNTVQ